MRITTIILASLLMCCVNTAVDAKKWACRFKEWDGKESECFYTCRGVCGLSAHKQRNDFLGALNAHGYSCRAEGRTEVSCYGGKNSGFGRCQDHEWYCDD
ncbi:uncharacterized protein VTP21DRAFT_734 [Calcarisporiella thermophila]|uniref:uncharacterized protein n=1 Tax=Calcarisporiella thermophila TaxID=911321 RepID=UPI0037432162